MERKLRESNARLRGLEERVDGMSYEELRRLQRKQAEEIEELRRLMANRPTETVQVVVPRSIPATEPVRRRATAARPAAAAPLTLPLEHKKPDPVQIVEPPKVEKQVESPKVAPRVVESPTPEEPVEQTVAVYFSPKHNPCLVRLGLRNGVEVLVPK